MKLRRYSVTVMDNWTPTREFWTLGGALRFFRKHWGYAYVFKWRDGGWELFVASGDAPHGSATVMNRKWGDGWMS